MRLAAIVVAVAACRGSSDAPPCTAAAGRFFTVARDDLATAKLDDATRRDVANQLPAMRDALDQACREGQWSAAVRACMVRAGDHVALQACEQALTEDQLRALDRASRGEPTHQ